MSNNLVTMSKVSVALLHQECYAMKAIRFDVLRVTVGIFFVSLLLFASAASAQTVVFGELAGKAIGITDLDIDGAPNTAETLTVGADTSTDGLLNISNNLTKLCFGSNS